MHVQGAPRVEQMPHIAHKKIIQRDQYLARRRQINSRIRIKIDSLKNVPLRAR